MHKLLLNPRIPRRAPAHRYELTGTYNQDPVFISINSRILVTNADTRTICEHAGCDVHGEEFLEEELGGVGDLDLGDAGFVVARTAFVLALFKLSIILSVDALSYLNLARQRWWYGRRGKEKDLRDRTHQSTNVANVDAICVTDFKETFLEKSSCTMRNHAITFHLSETQPTITRPTLHGLAG
jgi:hypothetical protein